MGRLLRLRRPGRTPYRKFGGSDTNLLSLESQNNQSHPEKTSGVEQIYNCSQCGHEGNLKMDTMENRLNNSNCDSPLSHQTSYPIRMDVINDLRGHDTVNHKPSVNKPSDLLALRKSLGSLVNSLSCVAAPVTKSQRPFRVSSTNKGFMLIEDSDSDVIYPGDSDVSTVKKRKQEEKPVITTVDTNCNNESSSSWAKISRKEELKLRDASWYQPGISREIATEVLLGRPVGSFLVRCSETNVDGYALSVRIPKHMQFGTDSTRHSGSASCIAHYLILASLSHGYRLKGSAKSFPSLGSLVVHHSVMKETLPCNLDLKSTTSTSAASVVSSKSVGGHTFTGSMSSGSEDESLTDHEDSNEEMTDVNEECPELIFTLRKALSSCS